MLWQSYAVSFSIVWLPWMLLAVDGAAFAFPLGTRIGVVDLCEHCRRATRPGGPSPVPRHLCRRLLPADTPDDSPPASGGRAPDAAWTLAFCCNADLFPLLEYTHTGSRMGGAEPGEEERPPVVLAAPPAEISALPGIYGSTRFRRQRSISSRQTRVISRKAPPRRCSAPLAALYGGAARPGAARRPGMQPCRARPGR